MLLRSLGISNLRNIAVQRLELGPGINAFIGPNGSGKTSVLEGAYLLSHGQSFRAGSLETIMSRGAEQMRVAATVERQGSLQQLALTRSRDGWTAQVNGVAVPALASLLQEFALVCLEPGTHALISGGSRERRQFLDWGVFHVEPEFWADMRRYNRVLRQRNAALKQNAGEASLEAWDAALAERATPVIAKRRRYFEKFQLEIGTVLGRFLPELGSPALSLDDGYSGTDLLRALRDRHRLDVMRGHTSRGPHRADWHIGFAFAPTREYFSRGQAKLCALACVIAQAKIYAQTRGEWPVVALDDLASELDEVHQAAVVGWAAEMRAQILVTGTELPNALRPFAARTRLFHVEHGSVSTLL